MPSDTYILTISDSGVSIPSSHANSHLSDGTDPIPTATSSSSGLMSAAIYDQHVANTAKVSNVTHTGDVTDTSGVLTVNKINGVSLAGLGGGVLKVAASTGIPSIATAADYPTLNQNTTGNAATATTATKATNIAGGATGSLPYQTANDSTSMLAAGTSGTVLKSNGAAAPSWSAVEKSMLSTALSNEITANTAKVSNKTHTGDVVDTDGELKVTGINNTSLVGLGSGLLKINSSGVPSIATSADLPPLTGNAPTATYATSAGSAGSATTASTSTYATTAGSAGSSTKATNLAGGSVGTIPYQTSTDTTAMLPAGSSGAVLKSNGAAAPSWSAVEKTMLSASLSAEITANTAKVSNKTHTGDVVDVDGALKVTALNNVNLADLGAGILKLDGSGRPSVVTAAEYPTLNQDTTGNAATATVANSSNKATNLAGGSAGTLPYQTANDTTAMLSVGSSGAVLKSNGAAAPSWSSVEKSMLSTTLANEITANTAKVSNKTHTGDVVDVDGHLTVTKINNVSLTGLGDGILKNNSSTGTPSIAGVNDFPTLNQNTTGNAATATVAVSAGIASNIAGGGSGSLPYQSNANTTGMVSAGASGTVLKSNGTSAPSWSVIEKSMLSETLSAEITANTAKVSNKSHTGDVVDVNGDLTVTKINNVSLVGLGDGILKNNNSNGRPSIASASDFPTLNQNTTGNAATATLASSSIKSTNIAGGVAGSIPYQTSPDQTVLLSPNNSGYLKTNGSAAPTWSSISASDISGTIPVSNGGTGSNSLTGYIKGSGTNAMTASTTIPVGDISGVIPVANGGTGATNLNGYVKGSGTSNLTASASIPVSDIDGTIPVSKGGTGAASLTGYVKGSGTSNFTADATVPVADISGTLPVNKGGTGTTSLIGYVKGNGDGNMTAQPTIPATDITGLPPALVVPDAGFVVSNGATLESVDDISLTADVSGILDVPNGGTGMAAPNGYLFGNGLGSMVAVGKIPAADVDGLVVGTVDLANVTGVLTPDKGGTGVFNPNGYFKGDGSGNVAFSTTIPASDIDGLVAGTADLAEATGILTADKGGTGMPSYLVGDLLVADTESTLSVISSQPAGGVLISNGYDSMPQYGKVDLSGVDKHVQGVLEVTNGGTGAIYPLTGYVKGNGTSAMTASTGIPVADIIGNLPVSKGGTGTGSLTGYVKGNGTSNMTASATIPVNDISGTLSVGKGGTGATTLTGYVFGNGAGNMTAVTKIPASDVDGAVTTTAVDLASSTGTLPVLNGGTGSTSLTGYVKGNGISPMTSSATVPVGDISGILSVGKGGTGGNAFLGYMKGNGTSSMTASATIPVNDISGTLSVGKGGTGATTLTGYVFGNGAGNMTAVAKIPASDIDGLVVGQSDLSNVTGVLAVSNGGTGSSVSEYASIYGEDITRQYTLFKRSIVAPTYSPQWVLVGNYATSSNPSLFNNTPHLSNFSAEKWGLRYTGSSVRKFHVEGSVVLYLDGNTPIDPIALRLRVNGSQGTAGIKESTYVFSTARDNPSTTHMTLSVSGILELDPTDTGYGNSVGLYIASMLPPTSTTNSFSTEVRQASLIATPIL